MAPLRGSSDLISATGQLFVAVLVWLARAVYFIDARRRGQSEGQARRFLVAPLGGMLVLALLFLDAPLRARWALSRSAFEDVVEAPGQRGPVDQSQRIGLYQIRRVSRVGDALTFYEQSGAFINEAGFAYLPDGPEPVNGAFESPVFGHFGGSWYTWTASW